MYLFINIYLNRELHEAKKPPYPYKMDKLYIPASERDPLLRGQPSTEQEGPARDPAVLC